MIRFINLYNGLGQLGSGDYDRVNVTILTICGALAGYFWYRIMRWHFQRKGLLPRDVHPPGSTAK